MVQKLQKAELSQLHRLQGQLKGVEKMIRSNYKLNDLMQQIEAVRGSLKSLEKRILTEKIKNSKDEELKKVISYIFKIS